MIQFSDNDVILVSGASSGIGKASAILLNTLGARVIGIGRNKEHLLQVQDKCKNPQKFFIETCDLTADIENIDRKVQELKDRFGKIYGLLLCAGECRLTPVPIATPATVEKTFSINVFAAFQLARAFLNRRNNIGAGASIVFIGSTGAFRENAGLSGYAASKGAVLALMRALACEYAGQGIRVNAISPGLIPTPMTERLFKEDLYVKANSYPLGSGNAEDIANTAAFLLSSASRWITGQNIVVDGGKSLA